MAYKLSYIVQQLSAVLRIGLTFTLLTHSHLIHRMALDGAQHSAWNGFARTNNLGLTLSIGAVASPLTPESSLEGYNTTGGLQTQGIF